MVESPPPDKPPIFDADMHLREKPEDFLDYIESPFTEIFDRAEEDYPFQYPNPGYFSPTALGKLEQPTVRGYEEIREAKEMLGLNTVLIQPSDNLFLACVNHPELATAIASAYNEWLLDEVLSTEEGIYGSILVAPQRPADAAAEINDRANESEMAAVLVPSGGVSPPLGNRRYDPIFEAAESAGLPITMHNASGTTMMSFPLQFQGYNRVLTNHITAHPLHHISHLADMIVEGVPVRFPDLDVVMQEGGIGWIPYMMRRLDNDYLNLREDAPMLDKLPSEYVRDQFYFTTQPLEGHDDPQYVEWMIQLAGIENILFSSDYPHFDFDHTEELLTRLSSFDDDELGAICSGNAWSVFDV